MGQSPQQVESKPHARPRWVKISAIVAGIAVAIAIGIAVLGGGQHGPGRHAPGGDAPAGHSPPSGGSNHP